MTKEHVDLAYKKYVLSDFLYKLFKVLYILFFISPILGFLIVKTLKLKIKKAFLMSNS